jgi:hypothetical protein
MKEASIRPRAVRVCQNMVVQLNARVNTLDSSIYHAISFIKYKKDAFDNERKCFVGKPLLDLTFGLSSARKISTILKDLLDSYDKQIGKEY